MKYKCSKCGEIYEAETNPEKCTACENDKLEEVIDSPEVETEDGQIVRTNELDKMKEKLNLIMKENELLSKQLALNEESKKRKEEDLREKEISQKKANMDKAERKEFESQQERQKLLDQQNQILQEREQESLELKKLKEENKQIAFENRKMKEKQQYYYIADKIDKCRDNVELDTIYKILDLKTEKARYDAENNGSGSIVHIKGTVPVADAKPKSLGQKLAESVNNKLSKKR